MSNIAYLNKLGLLRGTNDSITTEMHSNDIETIIKLIKAGNLLHFTNEVKNLTSKKVDLNTPTTGGWTCLHYAAYLGRSTIVNELLTT